MNVAMYHWPSAKSVTGPRSTSCRFWPRNAGRTREAGDRHGDDAADHAAEAERRALEELAAREALAGLGCGIASPTSQAGRRRRPRRLAALRLDVDRLPAELGGRVARPEEAEDDAIAPPIVEIQSGLMIRPTRRTAMPIAKPIGQRVGGGRCGSSWGFCSSAIRS